MRHILILHNVRSLHNVGSIFRTADGAGIEKIYLTGYTPTPYDFFGKIRPDFAKTALGAEKFVSWEKEKSISKLLKNFTSPPEKRSRSLFSPPLLRKERGLGGEVFILALEQSSRSVPHNLFLKKYSKQLKHYNTMALIVGNEVRGISPSTLKKSDAIIEIPMRGKKESLNVSVATGIALYAIIERKSLKI